jgi:hypothetical protein
MEPRVSLLTLGVGDFESAVAFYRDGLGCPSPRLAVSRWRSSRRAGFDRTLPEGIVRLRGRRRFRGCGARRVRTHLAGDTCSVCRPYPGSRRYPHPFSDCF